MSDQTLQEIVELRPIPPDTVESVQTEAESYILEGLERHGKGELVNKEIKFEVEETFPTAEVVHVAFTLGAGVALEVFKQVILPWLKKKYETRQKSSARSSSEESSPPEE